MKPYPINPKRFHILLVVVLLCSMNVPVRAQEGGGFQETFDDPGLPGWEHSPNVSVAAGVLRIEPDGFAFHGGQWSDLTLSLRARRIGAGSLAIRYSRTDAGAYVFGFGSDYLALIRNEGGTTTELAAAPVQTPAEQWVQVGIIVSGGVHTISLDGQAVLTATDPQPLPPGGVVLQAAGSATGEFDDLSLFSGGTPPPPAELTATSVPATQGTLSWVRLGGPPGGLGYDIRYNFADPNLWYVTDNNAGVHISTDNGYTWQPSNTGIPPQAGPTGDSIPIFSLTVDPHHPQIVWVGTNPTGHIYKSTDGGHTWEQKDNGIVMEYAGGLTFRGFTIDPTSSDIVYAMGETSDPITGFGVYGLGTGGVVYKTTDGGENWVKIWDGGIPSSLARYMWIDPRDTNVLYVSTGIFDRGAVGESDSNADPYTFGGLGILKSTDGGQTWRLLNKDNGLNNLYVGSLYMHPENPDILLAATGHLVPGQETERLKGRELSTAGIYRTTDGGEHWVQVLAPPLDRPSEFFTAVEMCPSDSNVVYAGTKNAVYRSTDAGQTWTQVAGGEQPWGPPGIEAGAPIDMQCDPRDTNRVFANNYNGGNFLSEDGGRTWQNASQGYTGAQVRSVAVDPTDPSQIYAAGRSGLWRSDDGGTVWHGLYYPPPADPVVSGLEWMAIAVDPDRPSHILAGNGRILESFDSGITWQLRGDVAFLLSDTSGGFSPLNVLVFAPSDPSIVYGAVGPDYCVNRHEIPYCSGRGSVLLSRDGGATWQPVMGSPIKDTVVIDLAVDPANAQIVYVATVDGLFKTTDGGTTWTPLSGLASPGPVRVVTVNPANPQVVLAGIEAVGVFVSADSGQTWQSGIAGLEANGSLHDMVFDPTNPQVVYASDYRSGVYRSSDGGYTWQLINQGLQNRAAMGMSISADGQHLYVATDGQGVFRLDLNGIPPE